MMGRKYVSRQLFQGRLILISSICLNIICLIALFYQWTNPCIINESFDESDAGQSPIPTVGTLDNNNNDNNNNNNAQSNNVNSDNNPTGPPPKVSLLVTVPPVEAEIPNDLSDSQDFQLSHHEITWNYCDLNQDNVLFKTFPFCPQDPTAEQGWQLGWYGSHVLIHDTRPHRTLPAYEDCVYLPPPQYIFPPKYAPMPSQVAGVHWPNLRVEKLEDLVVFNKNTPKNLYHFNAPVYDLDGLEELKLGAKYIPFGPKIRLMLDIGAGGGSLGLLLKRKYDVQVLASIFPDWPYCEYISERGGLCMLVDVMEAMPFAKFTFDVIHVSWVYHGQQPDELVRMFLEINRILRPGGYLWMRGGYSVRQVQALEGLASRLGWQALYDKQVPKPDAIQKQISFGPDLSYNKDWWIIWLKPIHTQRSSSCQ